MKQILSFLFCAATFIGLHAAQPDTLVLDTGPEPRQAAYSPRRLSDTNPYFKGEITSDKLVYTIWQGESRTVATLMGWADSNDYYSDLVIPDRVPFSGGYVDVTAVNAHAFMNGWGIKSVTFGANIMGIDANAFFGCSISKVVIPQSVIMIGRGAFSGNPLESVTFENPGAAAPSLSIGTFAFTNTALTSFELPARASASAVATGRANILGHIATLRAITINSGYTARRSAKSEAGPRFAIVKGALCVVDEGASTTAVVAYPCGRDAEAFELTAGNIEIYDEALAQSNITALRLTATSTADDTRYRVALYYYAAARCPNLAEFTVNAAGRVRLDPEMAQGCSSLREYTLGEGVTNFRAFDGVLYAKKDGKKYLVSYPAGKRDESFEVPSDVLYLGEFAMCYNDYIRSVRLPDELRGIGDGALAYCKSLGQVDFHGDKLANVGGGVFEGTPYVYGAAEGPVMLGDWLVGYAGTVPADLVLGEQVRNAAAGVFGYNENIRSVRFPKNFRTVPSDMFLGCSNLASVTWPDNLVTIGSQAFTGTGLVNLSLPLSCRRIMIGAFSSCRNLVSINIGDGSGADPAPVAYETGIAEKAFAYAYSCREINIGRGFDGIHARAFLLAGASVDEPGCRMDISVPEGVRKIGQEAFSGCRNVKVLSLPTTLDEVGAGAFIFGDNALTEVAVARATPPSATEDSPAEAYRLFTDEALGSAALVIPEGVEASAYTANPAWNFSHVGHKVFEGVDDVLSDDGGLVVDGRTITSSDGSAVLELFSADGRAVARGTTVTAPSGGMYFVRAGSRAIKIAVF